MKKSSFLILLLIPFLFFGCQTGEKQKIEQYSINQFMENTSVFGSSFSPDGKKLLFTSNETGVYNAFEVSVEGGDPQQITDRQESTYGMSYFPEDERIILTSDQGGNEINHLFVRETDGSIHDITPDSTARASFGGWSHDRKSYFYLSNKRDPRFMDLFEVFLHNMEPAMIFENKKGFNYGSISEDKELMAVTKTITQLNNNMFLYNFETGETKLLSEHEGDITFSPVDFSADNEYLYYLTDEDSEFKYLMKMNLSTGEKEKVFEAEWDVMYAYHSYHHKYRVIGINRDAQTVIKMFDMATGNEVEFPELPGQNITSVNISDNEDKMAFYVSNSRQPSNLYIYDFETGEYQKLTNSLNPEINPDYLVDGEVIRYTSFDGVEIPSILYKPVNASGENKVPVLVAVHGGPGGQSRIGYRASYQYLANHGYAVIAVNNRGSSGYGKTFYAMDDLKHGEDDLQDCIYAKDFLAETGWVDTNKIGIIGGSYGGYMVVAALAFTPEAFDVGVDIFGVTNWLRTLKSIPSWWEAQREALYIELGNPETDSAYLYKISPLFHAANITKPLIVLQGANDPRVLKVESDEIVEITRNNGVPVEYVVFDDEGHGFRKKKNEIESWGKILAFLDKYLKGKE